MKKIALILVFAILLTLVSCGSEPAADVSARELLDASLALFDSAQTWDPSVYYSDAEEGSEHHLDEGYMSYLFYGEYDADIPALPMIAQFATAIHAGQVLPFEITIVKAKSTAAANEVKLMLESRQTIKEAGRGEIQNYDSSLLGVLDACEIYKSGVYVMLIATPDNRAVKEVISGLLGGGDALALPEDSAETTAPADATRPADASRLLQSVGKISDAASYINTGLTDGKSTAAASADPSQPLSEDSFFYTWSGNNLLIFGGRCVEGAKIHVRGGAADMTFGTDGTSWLVEVEIPAGVSTLTITQQEAGKGESAPVTVTVQPRTDVDLSGEGVCQVAVGDQMQGHFFGQMADWMGTNLLTDKQVEGTTSRVREKVDYLSNLGCELIYVIVPNPIAIYPETAPARWERSTADTTRTEQFCAAAEAAGATVIELTDILNAHRDDEYKIYHKTDSHWTDYGAYWGYYALMNHIAASYPDAAPVEIGTDIEFYTKEVISGDMMTHLRLKNSLLTERATFVRWKIPAAAAPNIYLTDSNELTFDPINQTKTVKNSLAAGKKLPTAMIVRDSFSTNFYQYACQSFAEVYWQKMWNYKFDRDYIERTSPDYYIILVTERNINNILS